MKKCHFPNIFAVFVSEMLTDAREMLVDAQKMQKFKMWVQGFQTHNLSCNLDENSLKCANLKIHEFPCFFMNFACFRSEIFDFCKNAKMLAN